MKLNGSRAACVLLFASLAVSHGLAPAQVPEWQIAAGKMAFEIASVKPSPDGEFRGPNFPLDNGDSFVNLRTGELPRGYFSAKFPLIAYITFAYKIMPLPEQRRAMVAHLSRWVTTESFDLEARAPNSNATKDQMRLMMQSLLAEKFHLAAHFEAQTLPAFVLVLAKPGKPGPNLLPHEKGPPCNSPAADAGKAAAAKDGPLPPVRGTYAMFMQPNGLRRAGSRDTTMERLAGAIPTFGEVERPVIDRTGLSGRFDFKLEWTRETAAGPPTSAPIPADSQIAGPTSLEALSDQLGLKLEATKAPVPVLVIDHVERPSEN